MFEYDINDGGTQGPPGFDADKRALQMNSGYGPAYYNLGLLYFDSDPYPGMANAIDRVNTAKSKAGNEHKCVWVTALQRVNWTKPITTANNCKPI